VCQGNLRDCNLEWNQVLLPEELNAAEKHSKHADLCICLGSSLQVHPAASFPLFTLRRMRNRNNPPGKIVIVNLQQTPKDKWAHEIIRGYVDDVMEIVMAQLNLEIPPPAVQPVSELENSFCLTRSSSWLRNLHAHSTCVDNDFYESDFDSEDDLMEGFSDYPRLSKRNSGFLLKQPPSKRNCHYDLR